MHLFPTTAVALLLISSTTRTDLASASAVRVGDGPPAAASAAPESPALGRLVNRFIVVPEHKLLFCYMEKVACQSFNQAFRDLRRPYDPRMHIPGGTWFRNSPDRFNWTVSDVAKRLVDPAWHKAVFHRDPLERLLSAYLSKCASGGDADGRRRCRRAFPRLEWPAPFTAVVDRLGNAREDPHFLPQHAFCGGLRRTHHLYNTTRPLVQHRSREDVLALLRAVGVDAHSAALALRIAFPPPAASCWSCHATGASKQVRAYYADADTVRKAVNFYREDYRVFGRRLPGWAWDLLGSNASVAAGVADLAELEPLRTAEEPRGRDRAPIRARAYV